MFDTMTGVKVVGGVCGSLLIFLFTNWAADALYFGGGEGASAEPQAYTIKVAQTGGSGEAAKAPAAPTYASVYKTADAAKGEQIFGKCKACHRTDGKNAVGPHLNGVLDRKRATVAGYSYSSAMDASHAPWTPENLFKFIEKPSAYVPGTKMPFAGLPDAQQRADLIAYLAKISPGASAAPTEAAAAPAAPAAAPAAPAASAAPSYADLAKTADAAAGEKIFSKCKACHRTDGKNAVGPHLNGVVGRDRASVAGFSYSKAMDASHAPWTPEDLFHFIEKPSKYVPGTKMPFAGIADAKQRADLVAYLETISPGAKAAASEAPAAAPAAPAAAPAAPAAAPAASAAPTYADFAKTADVAKGETLFTKCKVCHRTNGTNAIGPHLNGVVNRDRATVADYSYSKAMDASHAPWTPDNLFAFLKKPSAYVPGTKMGFAGLPDPQERADLIGYLETLK